MDIIGHKRIIEYLENAHDTDKLAHAYLFVGPEHVGKNHVAHWFAKRLLCNPQSTQDLFGELSSINKSLPCENCSQCKSLTKSIHPDLLTLDLEEDKHQISIKSMKTFLKSISMSPSQANRKVAIVQSADSLSLAAENAFLKTLEEAPQSTTIVLISHKPELLLPTIKSRCQLIEFSHQIDLQGQELLVRMSTGLPGLLISFQEHPNLIVKEQNEVEEFISFFKMSSGLRLKKIEHYFKKSKKHVESKDDWKARFILWKAILRDMIYMQVDRHPYYLSDTTVIPKKGNTDCRVLIDHLDQIEMLMWNNIHLRTHLEKFLLSL